MKTVRCESCGRPATPEDRLLAAIFGHRVLCPDCMKTETMDRCCVCGYPTLLLVDGRPYCREHIENFKEADNEESNPAAPEHSVDGVP